MDRIIDLPLTDEVIGSFHAGDRVLLSGEMLVMRDAAHERYCKAAEKKETLPFSVSGKVIYYMGPTPAREGRIIGSAGPTTSARMDRYTPRLLSMGLKGMVGKGRRAPEVIDAMEKHGAVYFAATGGCGALLSECITSSKIICYEDLGAEAVRLIEVKDFPCIVAADCHKKSLY